jgi:hypothetical protein
MSCVVQNFKFIDLKAIQHKFRQIIFFIRIGSWNYSFNRDIERVGIKNLKAKIIVELYIIEDMTGSATHKVFTSTSNYEMSITEDVIEDDFFQLYQDAYQKMKEVFLNFQKQNGMQPAPFNVITKRQVKKDLSDKVAWYYSP